MNARELKYARQAIKVLEGAKAKVRQGWTRYAFARDANGDDTYPKDTNAVSWCALGAIEASSGRLRTAKQIAHHSLEGAAYERFAYNVPHVNDEVVRDRRSIISLYNQAQKNIAERYELDVEEALSS